MASSGSAPQLAPRQASPADVKLSLARDRETAIVRRRYDRVAPMYDLMQVGMEMMARRWRHEMWSSIAPGEVVLEVGVGTGSSIASYPAGADVTAIDFSPRMLARAQRRAEELGARAKLEVADVQALPYDNETFDVAVTGCVFCSVPDPVLGLSEIRRVLKPSGRLLMLEHVLSRKPFLRAIMKALDFIPYYMWGAHIARDTVDNVRAAGFPTVTAVDLVGDVVKRIEARKATLCRPASRGLRGRGGQTKGATRQQP